MAAIPDKYERSSQLPTVGPSYTDGTINNNSDKILVLQDDHIWHGSALTIAKEIAVNKQCPFTHAADAVASAAGLWYSLGDNLLVVAWSNDGNSNKVYAVIVPTGKSVDWDQIERTLATSQNTYDTGNQCGYNCTLQIDSPSGTPKFKATFKKAT